MTSRKRTTRIGLACVLAVVTLQNVGCGTILYPERRGQTGGKIDPGVAILDGVGILLYVIPGLIAFGVDFTTGAIYLPHSSGKLDQTEGKSNYVVRLDPAELTHERIERLVAEETGHTHLFEHKDLTVTRFTDRDGFLGAYSELTRPSD